VGADVNLISEYGIPLQELPLLCRRLLEGQAKIGMIMFSEADMVRYANERATQAHALAEKRRARRPPVSSRAGQAWRGAPATKREQ
jgi:hypothetical protein